MDLFVQKNGSKIYREKEYFVVEINPLIPSPIKKFIYLNYTLFKIPFFLKITFFRF